MSFITDPPGLLVGVGSDIPWGQAVVLDRMPFLGHGRIDGLETIVFTYRLASAIRATLSAVSGRYWSFPFMLLATNPPDSFPRTRGDILRSPADVFGRMPFFRQAGVDYLKIIPWS
jgi:hypothetical protein